MPSETPDNLECIEAANRLIAEYYAPNIYHMTDMSSDRSVGGRADLITSVFFDVDFGDPELTDGDLSTGNNWTNLENYSSGLTGNIDALDPYVYYSVVWAEDYWIIAYGYYHPRDWAGGGACCGTPFTISDSHENDYEASIFVISRDDYNLKGAFATFHKKFLKYSTTEIDLTNNPNVFIDDRTHGPVMNLTSGECIEDSGNPCDGCKAFFPNNPNFQVVYTPSENGEVYVNTTPGTGERLYGEGKYKLEDIFGSHEFSLNNQRDNPFVFRGPANNQFYAATDENCLEGGSASAPWGFGNFKHSKQEIEQAVCFAETGDHNCFSSSIWNPSSTIWPVSIEYNPYFPQSCDGVEDEIIPGGGMITIDETVTWDLPEDAVVGDIIIKDGGDLRITDRTVLFKPGAGIVIEEGGQLLTSGATLDVCPQALEGLKWRGIYAPNSDSDITVALTQETIIRNAETGLLLGAQFRDGNGLNSPTVALNNAWFIDNNIGVNSLSNDLSQFNHCHFINNEFGIRLSNAGEEVEHLKIIYSEFIDNEFGIVAFNSSLRIDSENTFTGGRAGIVAGSTDPITSNIIIGRPSSNSGNTFTDMRQAIVIMGVGGPLGVSIINNTFSNIEGSAVQMIGESSFTVANNSFNNSGEGVFVTESGSMSNRIQCNTFTQSEKVDIILYGINTSTQFLENDYNSPNASYKNLAWSATLPDMGSEALSASNCFNDDVGINPDIRSVSSNNFTYYYKNTNECQEQEPNDLSSVLKLVANEPGNNCLNGIGPFNFIDPGNGNGGQVDINNFNAEFVCKSCVLDRIEYHKGQIVANGGNNPETGYVSVETPTTDLVKKEQLFEQWINFGLYVADEKKDYDFAENILSPLNDWKWKARYYGLSLQKEDFSEAANRLAALPNVNSNQAAFKSTQEINLKYLTAKASGTESEITKEDVETLKDIGLSYKLSSGYARTLLLLLTGEMLPTSIPELKEFINKDQAQEKEEVENSIIPVNETIAIFPNPARDYIQIKSESDVITQILLSDIYGKGVLKKRGNYLSTRVETTGLNTGIYLIQIQLENGELISQKIIIDN